MPANKRDRRGQFALGNPGGPGRPPLVTERQYLETLGAVCTVEDWQKICEKAVTAAMAGDHRAREWLSKYVLGDPQHVASALHARGHTMIDGYQTTGKYDHVPGHLIIKAKTAIAELMKAEEIGKEAAGLQPPLA